MKIRNITLAGMGALGVMYGDFLTKKLGKDRVSFVADMNRLHKYETEGVFCNGHRCDFSVVDETDTAEADLLIFAVKATGLSAAIQTARNQVAENTIILSVLNGISSEEILGKAFGAEKVIPCVVQGMDAMKTGNNVQYTQFGQFYLGIDAETAVKKQNLAAIAALFDETGIPYTVEIDILRRIWSKFMLNVGVNQAVMIFEGTYATVQTPGPARDLMQSAMREVMVLAEKENIFIPAKDFDDYIALIDQMNPAGMPSMRQDGLAQRPSEVDFFAGTVLALADKHGFDAPVNRRIYQTIAARESAYPAAKQNGEKRI